MKQQEKKLTFSEKLSYGMGDCAANVYVAMASTFMTGYYTDTVGIAALSIGTMMLIARIFDGITDLMMGAIVDKTNSRFGKARPWVLWTAPFMGIGLIALFSVPSSMYGKTSALVYAYITYILMNCIVYTANNLPYNALLSRMTLNVQDRAVASAMRFVMTQITTLVINAVTANLLSSVGWTGLSVIYAIVMVIMLVWCFLGCHEHLDADESTGEIHVQKVPLSVALKALGKNRYFFLQALLFMTLYINVVSVGSTTYYFCNVVLGDLSLLTYLSMANTIPAIIVNFLSPSLVYRFGKRKVMLAGAGLMLIGSLIIGAAGSNFGLVMFGLVLKSFGYGPVISGIFALTADVVDYGEWKTGIRSEGLVNSCTSFGMKVGIGLGSACCTWILAAGGYDGTAAVQSASAIAAIRFGFGYFGAIMSVLTMVIIFFINIDKDIKTIQADLEAKRHGK